MSERKPFKTTLKETPYEFNESTLKAMHESVYDYVISWTGEPIDSAYLHEEIDNPNKRTKLFEEFIEWYRDQLTIPF